MIRYDAQHTQYSKQLNAHVFLWFFHIRPLLHSTDTLIIYPVDDPDNIKAAKQLVLQLLPNSYAYSSSKHGTTGFRFSNPRYFPSYTAVTLALTVTLPAWMPVAPAASLFIIAISAMPLTT